MKFRQDPVELAALLVTTLTTTTVGGAQVGFAMAGPQGAKTGAVIGLLAGIAIVAYCVKTQPNPDPYMAALLSPV